uniref:Uncharacterized protein n=1 Tax=viral metagenome TaxID=1070528 RepID=A0A6H1ZV52_9ZZZZ
MAFPQAWEEVALVSISKFSSTTGTCQTIEANVMTDTVDLPEPDYPGESIPNLAGGRIWKQSPQEDGEFTLEFYPRMLEKSFIITAIDGDATTITVNTGAVVNGFAAGDLVNIDGTTNYNGTYTIATISDAYIFTIASTAHNAAAESTGQASHCNTGLFQHFAGGTHDTTEPLTTDTTWGAGIDRTRDRFRVAIMWTDDVNVTSANNVTSATDSTAMRFVALSCRMISHKASFTDKILKVTATFKYPAMNKAGDVKMFRWESTNDGDTSPLLVLPPYDDDDSYT